MAARVGSFIHSAATMRPPIAGITCSDAGREGGHDAGVDGLGEVDDASPLLLGQYTSKAGGRVCWRLISIREVGGVGPRPADPHIGRPQSGSELAQARTPQVDGWPILVQGWVHAGRRTGLGRRDRGRLPEGGLEFRAIRPPEPSARHLEHFHIVGLIALVDRADPRHRRR